MSRRKRRQTVFPRAGTVARNVKKSLSCAWLLKQDIFSLWYLFREIPCKDPTLKKATLAQGIVAILGQLGLTMQPPRYFPAQEVPPTQPQGNFDQAARSRSPRPNAVGQPSSSSRPPPIWQWTAEEMDALEEQDLDIEAWQRLMRVIGDFRKQGSPLLHLQPFLTQAREILNNWAEASPARVPQPEVVQRAPPQWSAPPPPRAPTVNRPQAPPQQPALQGHALPAPGPTIVAQPQQTLMGSSAQGRVFAPAGLG